jgi:two-component system response regulator
MNPSQTAEILLVEDNTAEAILITRAIKKSTPSLRVFHVKDGVEALDFLYCRDKFVDRKKNDFPRLIILDLKMPRMDGLEVLQVIKSDDNTKSIPVVMLTTSQDDKDMQRSYLLGANSYVLKSANLESIHATAFDISHYWLEVNSTN